MVSSDRANECRAGQHGGREQIVTVSTLAVGISASPEPGNAALIMIQLDPEDPEDPEWLQAGLCTSIDQSLNPPAAHQEDPACSMWLCPRRMMHWLELK